MSLGKIKSQPRVDNKNELKFSVEQKFNTKKNQLKSTTIAGSSKIVEDLRY